MPPKRTLYVVLALSFLAVLWGSWAQSEDAALHPGPAAASPSGGVAAPEAGKAVAEKKREAPRPQDLARARELLRESQGFFVAGKLEEAIKTSAQALALAPELQEAWVRKGLALHAQASYREALASFDEALRVGPPAASILVYRGLSLMGVGRMEDAGETFARARALDPALKGPALLQDRALAAAAARAPKQRK